MPQRCARAYNNWLYDYCAKIEKIDGCRRRPVQDVSMAIGEAKESSTSSASKAFLFRPNPVNGRNIDDPYYDPLYKTVVDLGVPLLVHEGSGAFLPTAGATDSPASGFSLTRFPIRWNKCSPAWE